MTRLVLAASTCVVAACASPDAPEGLPYTERDSAGVVVVENHFDAAPGGWAVGASPTLVVGGMEAPEADQLFRITGALLLPDGRIALSNSGTGEIRILDGDGTRLSTHGRQGDGPGEFQTPTLLGLLAADSLLVWDQGLRRVSVVHVDDGFARSYQIDWGGVGFPVARGMMTDGSVVIGGGMSFSSDEGFPTGVIRPESTFGWVTADGEETHVGDFPASEMFARASNEGFMARGLPYGRFAISAAAPAGVWVGTAEAYELRYYGISGVLERVLRLDAPRLAVTDDDVEAYIRVNVDEDTNDENRRRELRAMTREMPIPEYRPPYQSVTVDTQGYLWVEDYGIPGEGAPTWTVFDPSGRLVGRLATPERTRLLQVGSDYILGRTADEFDVESLTLWTLTRPTG